MTTKVVVSAIWRIITATATIRNKHLQPWIYQKQWRRRMEIYSSPDVQKCNNKGKSYAFNALPVSAVFLSRPLDKVPSHP